jgi:hypothetical protein
MAREGGCTYGAWSEWSPCWPVTAQGCVVAGGSEPYQWRQRSVQSADPGIVCSATFEKRACNPRPPDCAIQDCELGPWTEFGPCSIEGTRFCGSGVTFRYRSVVKEPSGAGARPCDPLIDFRACDKSNCTVGCRVGPWGEWDRCDADCGGGLQRRERTVTPGTVGTNPPCNQLAFDTHRFEERACNTHSCAQNCVLGDWEPQGECSANCGGGQQLYVRKILRHPTGGGTACPLADSLLRMRYDLCNAQPCASAEDREEKDVATPDEDEPPPPTDDPVLPPRSPPPPPSAPAPSPSPSTQPPQAPPPQPVALPIPVEVLLGILGVVLVVAVLGFVMSGSGSSGSSGRRG